MDPKTYGAVLQVLSEEFGKKPTEVRLWRQEEPIRPHDDNRKPCHLCEDHPEWLLGMTFDNPEFALAVRHPWYYICADRVACRARVAQAEQLVVDSVTLLPENTSGELWQD